MDVLSEAESQAGKQAVPTKATDAGPPPAMAFGMHLASQVGLDRVPEPCTGPYTRTVTR